MLAKVWLRCLLVAGSLIGAVRPDGGLLRQWGGIRARDFWTLGAFVPLCCSPDYESGALARLGYPGVWFLAILFEKG
jgi:hypothetical protein